MSKKKKPNGLEMATIDKTEPNITNLKQNTNGASSISEETIEEFDEILEIIGSKGPYQKFLLYFIVCPIIAILPLVTYNSLFVHNEMDHWCYVEGTDSFNETQLEGWKKANLPREKGPDGRTKYSSCTMYADSDGHRNSDNAETTDSSRPIIDCENGWAYDRSELTATIISDYNWVCSKNHYLTTLYTVNGIGLFIGAFFFGLLADKYGRKPLFFITMCIFLGFRIICLFIPQHYLLYLILSTVSATGFNQIFVSPTMVTAELCDDEFRSWTYAFTAIVWVIGMAAIPYVAYLCQTWFLLGAVTTFPCLLVFLYIFIFPESPRWLISAGRVDEAAKIIKDIAKKNGTDEDLADDKLHDTLNKLVRKQHERNEQNGGKKSIGVWTLLSRKTLASHTILLSFCFSINSFIYDGITLNTPNLPGDQFFNFFLLAMIEIPSSFLGGWLVEHLGRRWTQVMFLAVSTVACFVAMFAVNYPNLSMAVTISTLVSKFAITITYLVIALQSTELYPTPLRSTGTSFGATITAIVALGTPGMVYVGHYYAPSPFIIMGVMSLSATIAAAFLPETLRQHLPETIEGANNFGKGNKFWSIHPKKKIRTIKHSSLRRSATNDPRPATAAPVPAKT